MREIAAKVHFLKLTRDMSVRTLLHNCVVTLLWLFNQIALTETTQVLEMLQESSELSCGVICCSRFKNWGRSPAPLDLFVCCAPILGELSCNGFRFGYTFSLVLPNWEVQLHLPLELLTIDAQYSSITVSDSAKDTIFTRS